MKFKFLLAILFISVSFFAFADDDEKSFGENLTSMTGHRFVEVRGAIPVFPELTTHGMVQSFVVGFGEVFGEIFSGGGDFDHTTPKFASDLNITFFPPIANYRIGFMAGVALDYWNSPVRSDNETKDEEMSMNFYYLGFHADYGHWVFSDIGTRLSIYGEVSVGVLRYDGGDTPDGVLMFDICPIAIQFCPIKNLGIYFELPHFGARPFFQLGVSLGF